MTESDLAEVFADIARQLEAEISPERTQNRVTQTAVATVDGCDHARSSREIGMAMGVLMSRGRLSQDEAFDLLRRASQHLHRKLRDVAADVVETGELPGRPPRGPSG